MPAVAGEITIMQKGANMKKIILFFLGACILCNFNKIALAESVNIKVSIDSIVGETDTDNNDVEEQINTIDQGFIDLAVMDISVSPIYIIGNSTITFVVDIKNIGSCTNISELREGTGPFTKYGVKVFDDYWINYMTMEMARSAKLKKPPYSNLKQYLKYRNINNV